MQLRRNPMSCLENQFRVYSGSREIDECTPEMLLEAFRKLPPDEQRVLSARWDVDRIGMEGLLKNPVMSQKQASEALGMPLTKSGCWKGRAPRRWRTSSPGC
ncbi:MAG: sigma-70 family RNA polymerase sigma factor [Candidatus Micrarchaeota archaeon]|nr:sigma-70 family RNA polymerase sigma factor [Candidatus Micrarchaeota archaeon]